MLGGGPQSSCSVRGKKTKTKRRELPLAGSRMALGT
jgi:hypothetical protein